jgi:Na+-transporting methylmalonyl-CoA/oxaloacetate decarboxylase beta subunit
MSNIHSTILVSLLLGSVIALGKVIQDPKLLLLGYAAFGGYWFWLLHKVWLAIVELATQGQ